MSTFSADLMLCSELWFYFVYSEVSVINKMRFFAVLLPLFAIVISNAQNKKPTILVSILVRNKAHTLPYFLSNLQMQNYPKDRISLRINSDHNSDNSLDILRAWISSVKDEYHSIHTEFVEEDTQFPFEHGPAHWTTERFDHVINLRESALEFARQIWADYLLAIDCDVFLVNPDTFNYLTSKDSTVVAPMLRSDSLYSNFWHGMTEDYYYQRSEEYKPVLYRETTGCFQVPMVHSCVLIDLRRRQSEALTYVPGKVSDYDGPNDDIIALAISANRSGVPMNVCNEDVFGYVTVPLEQYDHISFDYEQLTNIKLEVLNEAPLRVVPSLRRFLPELPEKHTMGFDRIFMINLLRRPERRRRMMACFDELGLDVTVVDAVDGKSLNESFLESIKFMPDFVDPYHKRPMKLGEIGCFMSHYNIWREIVAENYESTLVLEDDIRFEPFFRTKVKNVMADVRRVQGWDLVYFGRKRLQEKDEPFVEGSDLLVWAGYSYWTLGYALSLSGAKKLLAGDPLSRLVPVDEYLPILFDKHPQVDWKGHYMQRNLVALSAAPLLLYPTHYTGEAGYVSDTEDSVLVPEVLAAREDL